MSRPYPFGIIRVIGEGKFAVSENGPRETACHPNFA